MARAGRQALADEAWGVLVAMMATRRDAAAEVAASYGLTPGDMKALLSLTEDDAPTMSVLAEAWSCDASNVTWLVDRLEEHGLVVRKPSLVDRRAKIVALTDRGRTARQQLHSSFTQAPGELTELSADDLETLCAVLRRTGLDPQSVTDFMGSMVARRH